MTDELKVGQWVDVQEPGEAPRRARIQTIYGRWLTTDKRNYRRGLDGKYRNYKGKKVEISPVSVERKGSNAAAV
jgi:hypothetical protein